MSKPIAQHADGSPCYTVNCTLGVHVALNVERESFVREGMAQVQDAREARRQAEFKQEWRERVRGWKDLGFQYPVSVRKSETWTRYSVQGKAALDHLSPTQLHALKFFTSNNYRWINAHLYGQRVLPTGDGPHRPFTDYRVVSMSDQEIEKQPTAMQVTELCQVLDGVLAVRQAAPRVVYRGVSRKALTTLLDMEKRPTDTELHDHVAAAYKVGAEVQVPGYLSASPSPRAAMNYAISEQPGIGGKQSGVFFEMLTSAGVNISGASMYGREAETLLPRNTRWRVAAVHHDKQLRFIENSAVNAQLRAPKPSTERVTLVQLVEIEN